MSKFKSSMLIFGCLILCVAAALGTFVALGSAGLVVSDPIEITFTVMDNAKTYDGTPLTATDWMLGTGDELLEGHTAEVRFVGEQTDFGTSESSADVKILNEKGADVSAQYAITVIPGLLTVSQRSISVRQEACKKEYTGEMLYADEYNVISGALCPGHRLVPSGNATGRIDAGNTPGEPVSPDVFDAAGNDVTANYRMSFTPGSITVMRRDISVIPIGGTKPYDGTPLYPSGYSINSGTLVAGHTVKAKFVNADGDEAKATYVNETVKFTVECTVFDAEGNDVTENYSIGGALSTADLTITPRPLTIVGRSGSGKYTGSVQGITDPTPQSVDGLASGDKAELTYSGEFVQASAVPYANDFTYSIMRDDVDVSANYTVNTVVGTYTIEKADLNTELRPYTVTYGDTLPELKELLVSAGGLNAEDLVLVLPEGLYSASPSGETQLSGEERTAANKKANVGTYAYRVDWAETADPEFRANYNIVCPPAMITVVQKQVTIVLKNAEIEYEGTAEGGIDTISDKEIEEYILTKPPQDVKNVGNYTYSAGWNEKATETIKMNYLLNVIPGTIIIKQKTLKMSDLFVKVTAGDDDPDDSAEPPKDVNFDKDGNLRTIEMDYSLTLTRSPKQINTAYLRNYKNLAENFDDICEIYAPEPYIKSAKEYTYTVRLKDSYNYKLEGNNTGKIVVKKAEAPKLMYNGLSEGVVFTKIYDGKVVELDGTKFTVDNAELVVSFAVVNADKEVNAGKEIAVKVSGVKLFDSETGEDVTSNYKTVSGNFTAKIDKRVLTGTITVAPIDEDDDPNRVEWADRAILSLNLAEGDSFNYNYLGIYADDGKVYLETLRNGCIVNSKGEDVIDNYSFINDSIFGVISYR